MFTFILSIILIFGALGWFLANRKLQVPFGGVVGWAILIVGLFLQATAHFVQPRGSEIVLMDRVYFGEPLETGLIATDGERGLQASTLPPGFQFKPFINVAFRTQIVPYTVIPEGHYGLVSARDGIPLEEGAVMAPPVPVDLFLDAEAFMKGAEIDGKFYQGSKGPQTTVLRPGAYPINLHLFKVQVDETTRATVIENGEVGVIKSAVNEGRRPADMQLNPGAAVDCSITEARSVGSVEVELVPVGCRGTWEEALPPGTYFLNNLAYDVTELETRTNVWEYAGGYETSRIDLVMNADGSVDQTRTDVNVNIPEGAVDNAIAVKVEGWTVYVDVRVQAQASPEQAPATVAAVGNLDAVRDRFITPDLRSVVRNIGGSTVNVPNTVAYDAAVSRLESLRAELELLRSPGSSVEGTDAMSADEVNAEIARLTRDIATAENNLPDPDRLITRPTLVLDFIENREVLEGLIEDAMKQAGQDAGVSIVGVKFGNVDIPPELLVARKREQLATQFRDATIQERLAQRERIETERERATADQQPVLVREQIARAAAEVAVERREDEGLAEQKYLEALAAGERARVNVIGEQQVVQLRMFEAFLAAIQETPELVTGLNLPSTVVVGGAGGNGITEAAGILSATQMFGGPATAPATNTGQ